MVTVVVFVVVHLFIVVVDFAATPAAAAAI
jgi:hypothetical protein